MRMMENVGGKRSKYKFVDVDPSRCIACGICELVCSFEKNEKKSFNPLYSRIKVVRLNGTNMAIACRVCEDAPCVKACPRNALMQSEDNGVIIVNKYKCTGCGWCLMVCDFGSIVLTEEGIAATCDLCVEREKSRVFPGRRMVQQACIEWCPEEALSLVNRHELPKKTLRETIAKLAVSET